METQKNTELNSEREARREVVRLRALRMDSLELSGSALLIWLPLLILGFTAGPIGFSVAIVIVVLELTFVHIQRIDVYADRLILSRVLLGRTIEYREIKGESIANELFLDVFELELADGRKVHLSRPNWHRGGARFDVIVDSLSRYRAEITND